MLSVATKGSLRIAPALVAGAMILSLTVPGHTAIARSAEGCDLCSVVPTVTTWLRHLEEGESRKAWRLMTRRSRRGIGGLEAFKRESSAWAEGWGAWAQAKKRDFEVRVLAPMDDDAASVVTMTGVVAQEGRWRRSAAALPVITRDRVIKVDPVHGPARVRPARPTEGRVVGRRPRFEALVGHIRARNNTVFFVVEGSRVEPRRAKLERIGYRSYRASLRWPRRLRSGPRVLTIATWGRHGFNAVAVRFKVRR